MQLAAGTRLGAYEVLAPLGAGAMGEVYRARHVKLRREAAVKVLPPQLASHPERLRRFEREARAASALQHPTIVTIYDIGEERGTTYIAMELVAGETLRARLAGGALPLLEALRLARTVAEGLAAAHAVGIVHRDLKPENLMVTADGRVKILDFGLAKEVPTGADVAPDLATLSQLTREGIAVGTVPYMAPEQLVGDAVSPQSDQFSLGVVLFEMLCGRRPFEGDAATTLVSAILRDEPLSLSRLRPEVPRRLADLVRRCLDKDPRRRFATTASLVEALRACESELAPHRRRLRLGRRGVAALLALSAATGVVLAWRAWRDDLVRWQRREVFAEVDRLSEAGRLGQAYLLAKGLERDLPDDPTVRRRLERITIPVSIVTEPAGADVELRPYASSEAAWVRLGETPLVGVRIPYALMQWRIRHAGYETFEGAPFGIRPFTALGKGLHLDPAGSRPEGMVRVPGGPYQRASFPAVELEDYWLDRLEVSNREYLEFVENGGYGDARYWEDAFAAAETSPAEVMGRLVDRTGRPGPAGWELGGYAPDTADDPVGGVSWYEAAAYCRWAGKSLPTLYHWSAATAQDQLSDIVEVSNFGGAGPEAVGTRPGLGDFGTYDMAGNVREWCWTGTGGGRRYILGGSWNEPTYAFRVDAETSPPLSRAPVNGIRCALYRSPPAEQLLAPVVSSRRRQRHDAPVDDEVFAAYRRIYAYDRTPLNATVESVDESSEYWRRETVTFDAAYGGERVSAHLFLPRNAQPPYQAVVWVPGNDAFFLPPGRALASPYLFDFVPRSGRALVYPVFKGTYERRMPFSFAPNEWRDLIVLWSKDLGRTVDYLESRDDIDAAKLGYYGFSAGAVYGPIFTAVDDRFGASVLLAGGLSAGFPPEADALNFAPRSQVPTLMINGQDDFLMPWEEAEQPLFRLLGAPLERQATRPPRRRPHPLRPPGADERGALLVRSPPRPGPQVTARRHRPPEGRRRGDRSETAP